MGYGSFYANVCRLLSSINGGICHRRPSVKLPMSKVGLELSRLLCNLGVLSDFSVGQRLQRVKGHARLWDPARTSLDSSAEAAGFPAMYLTLHLNWDKHKPLYSSAVLAAAPPPSAAAEHGASGPPPVATPDFSPPMGLNSPTPESIKIISKPSAQRWLSLRELLRARSKARPGIYLLSTHQGLITDIDAELRGIGGIVLAHIGLPLGHVVQLRGLLRQKHQQELAAAAAAAAAEPHQQRLSVAHVPLCEWDARRAAGAAVSSRLAASRNKAGTQYLNVVETDFVAPLKQQQLEARQRLRELAQQEAAWKVQAAAPQGGSSSSSSSREAGERRWRARSSQ